MSLAPLPPTPILTDGKGMMTLLFQSWFSSVQQWLAPQGQFGTTADRPVNKLYIGLSYFDTTLGFPVFVKQVSPSVIWVRYDGTAV